MKGINRHGVVCINAPLTTQLKSSDRRESPAVCPISDNVQGETVKPCTPERGKLKNSVGHF